MRGQFPFGLPFFSMQKISSLSDRIATGLCLLGGLGLLLAVLATCWSAMAKFTLRQFNALWGAGNVPETLSWIKPLRGEDEVVALAVCFALFAALPFVTLRRAHIRIDLFEPLFGKHINQILTILGDCVLVVLAYLFVRQQWNLIFKPARVNRGQDPLIDLIWQGDWAQIWGKRFLDSKQSQVMGLEFWPFHIWAEICSVLFCAAALVALMRSLHEFYGSRIGTVTP